MGLEQFARYQPFTPVTETLRGLLTGTPIGGVNAIAAVAWSLGIAVVSYLWARHLYAHRRPCPANKAADDTSARSFDREVEGAGDFTGATRLEPTTSDVKGRRSDCSSRSRRQALSCWRTGARLLGKVLGELTRRLGKPLIRPNSGPESAEIAPRRSPVRVRLVPLETAANRGFLVGRERMTTSRRSDLRCTQLYSESMLGLGHRGH
jgi:hypothetical protein